MEFTDIPLPPSLNQSYPTNRFTGGRFKAKELVLWEREFQTWALVHCRGISEARKALSARPMGCLELRAQFYFEHSRLFCKDGKAKRLDVDNRLKHLLDALAKILWTDDNRFFRIVAEKIPVSGNKTNYVDVQLQWMNQDPNARSQGVQN